ncbi:MAG: hypothetical protein Q9166_002686 [cf. Caloplaca sp. 2 TL-2023]
MNIQQTNPVGPVQWDPNECRRYIVEVLGNQERFPERKAYHPGSSALQQRLHQRYGEDYAKSCSKALRNFLEDLETGTSDEQAIWQAWRLAHSTRVRDFMA